MEYWYVPADQVIKNQYFDARYTSDIDSTIFEKKILRFQIKMDGSYWN